MRMNYKSYPTDYVQQLNSERGTRGRKKSRAFLEYWNDMEHGMYNSESFYAKSWDISRSTAHEWIKEYTIEIDLFLSHWSLRNQQQYSNVQKLTKQNEQIQPSKTSAFKHRNLGSLENVTEQNEQTQPREDFNLNNNNARAHKEKSFWSDKEFNDLFFIYGQNTKFKGRKEEAFAEFLHVEINVDLLKLASVRYLHDPETEGKRYNLTNFLKNQTYISYLPKRMKIIVNDKTYIGSYDDKSCMFLSDAKDFAGELSAKRLVEMFESHCLEFIK